ncbi:MAG: acyltransferase family protein [Planctomycetota bacterium]
MSGNAASKVNISDPSDRVLALDAVRGFTVAMMVFVNGAGDYMHRWRPFTHAPWNGWTFADLGFPAFLLMMGAAMVFSIDKRMAAGYTTRRLIYHITKRGILLILFGWVLSAFTASTNSLGDFFGSLRLTGILPKLGAVYLLGGLAYILLKTPARIITFSAIALAAHTWVVFGAGAKYAPDDNIQITIDRAILGNHGLPAMVRETDADGLLTILPGIVCFLAGALAGRFFQTKLHGFTKGSRMVVAGLLMIGVAIAADRFLPINRSMWTASYVILTCGWTAAVLGLAYWLIDGLGFRQALRPLFVYGRNPLAAFLLLGLFTTILVRVRVPESEFGHSEANRALVTYLFDKLKSFVTNPYVRSHAIGAAQVIMIFMILWILDRRRIYWRA